MDNKTYFMYYANAEDVPIGSSSFTPKCLEAIIFHTVGRSALDKKRYCGFFNNGRFYRNDLEEIIGSVFAWRYASEEDVACKKEFNLSQFYSDALKMKEFCGYMYKNDKCEDCPFSIPTKIGGKFCSFSMSWDVTYPWGWKIEMCENYFHT